MRVEASGQDAPRVLVLISFGADKSNMRLGEEASVGLQGQRGNKDLHGLDHDHGYIVLLGGSVAEGCQAVGYGLEYCL
jgi:hypothetical protein